MTATKLQPKGYDYILKDLREHKEKVDRAIRALEALRDSAIPTAVVLENGAETSHKEADTYSGMYFLDALRDLFAKMNGPLTTSQITEGLLRGGFSSDSANPKKVIAAQLHRHAGNVESGIVKTARSLWALDKAKLRRSS
jgi:hypothetical protein